MSSKRKPKYVIDKGQRFGRLKVIGEGEFTPGIGQQYLCECSCDNHTRLYVYGFRLKNGSVQSCGCLRKERKIPWHLVSPEGIEYQIDDLHDWIRKNCNQLFSCDPDSDDMYKIYTGFAKAKGNYFKTKAGKGVYKGWKIIPTDEDIKRRGEPKSEAGNRHGKLTSRQKQILDMFKSGKNKSQIAREIGCTPQNISDIIRRAKNKDVD